MADIFFGVPILGESEQVPSGTPFGISFTIVNKQEVKEAEHLQQKFEQFSMKFFIDLVGEIHKYLLRVAPMHTGRLRGSFTGFLEKYRIDYSRQLLDTTLYNVYKSANSTPEHKKYDVSDSAIQEGRSLSRLEDKLPSDLDVAIYSDVKYVDYANYGTSKVQGRHFIEDAFYKGELLVEKHFSLWVEKMEKAGAIVEAPEVEEID